MIVSLLNGEEIKKVKKINTSLGLEETHRDVISKKDLIFKVGQKENSYKEAQEVEINGSPSLDGTNQVSKQFPALNRTLLNETGSGPEKRNTYTKQKEDSLMKRQGSFERRITEEDQLQERASMNTKTIDRRNESEREKKLKRMENVGLGRGKSNDVVFILDNDEPLHLRTCPVNSPFGVASSIIHRISLSLSLSLSLSKRFREIGVGRNPALRSLRFANSVFPDF
ncbi:hypothetical protein L6452_10903 [Arctium lappa]|uniref:Uncharacterized protein n=1 Tax=Arctium lappa TaxID=4217 RepID=A0ACB9DNK9_ARCLA|nr:hypothetical protein L6452_10903 [Arctium lappa]